MAKKILLIDGNSLIYRAYFANSYRTQTILKTSDGIPTNAVYSFINMILSLLGKENYDEVKVAFDAGKQTFRHQKMATYKAKRQETPQELLTQLPIAREFLDKIGIQWFALEQFEADDIIACLNKMLLQRYPDAEVDILTSDRDLYQLISSRTHILVPRSGTSDLIVMDEAELMATWHTKPKNVPDLKGLMGDSSDNLVGVPGIGEKTAIGLIDNYRDLETIYAHLDDFKPGLKAKLIAGKESAFFTREMATLHSDCPLSEIKVGNFELDLANLKSFLERYEMKSILRRLGLNQNQEESFKQLKVKHNALKTPRVQVITNWNSQWNAIENTIYVESLDANYHEGRITGISIFNEHGLFYWDWNWTNKQLTLFETPQPPALDHSFNKFLQAKQFRKNTYDVKRTLTLLTNAGYQPNPQSFDYDMLLAAYDLDPTMIPNFAHYAYLVDKTTRILTDEAFFGTGIKRNSQPKNKANFISQKALIIAQTKPQFTDQLKALGLDKLYYRLDLPLAICLFHMEQNGVKIDPTILKHQLRDVNQKMARVIEEVKKNLPLDYQHPDLNLNSPQQIQHLLFKILNLPDNFKGSSSHEALVALADLHPIPRLIIEYRNLDKWRSSLEAFKRYLQNKTKIHTTYHQTAVVTGRISSKEPNLQTVAVRDEGQKEMRRIFVAEKNWLFYSFDYAQIELRVLATIAPEPHLVEFFLHNQDPHEETARKLFQLSPHQTVSAEQRRLAKVFNFGIIYGLTPYGLTQQISMPLTKAKELTAAYFATFPRIKDYQEQQIATAKTKGYISTITHRRRLIPELKSAVHHLRQLGERIAINTPAQSTSADIIKMAMVNIDQHLTAQRYRTEMLAQIHDELIFHIPQEELDEVVPMIKKQMESAFEDLMQLVNPKFKVKVPLKVSIKSGPSWYELK